jgi:deazaflavin-dependent oxidoreductase (nitroreductase family)
VLLTRSEPQPRKNILAGKPVKLRVRALDLLIRPLFAHGPFRGMGVLTTIGRRSGKPRRHAVRAIRDGSRAYLVAIPGAHAAWLSNLRANPRVTLEIRGTTCEGTARELARGPERDAAKAVYVGTVNGADYVECFLHWRGVPARWKIQRLHDMWFEGGIPIVIDLDPPDRQETR